MSKKSKTTTIDPKVAAAAIGRLGGLANTAKQQSARKKNGKLAGRPRRVCVHCGEPVRGGHVDLDLDTKCGAHGWRWQTQNERRAEKGKARR